MEILEKINLMYLQPEILLHPKFSLEGFSLPERDNLKLYEVADNNKKLRDDYEHLIVNQQPNESGNYLLLDSDIKFKKDFNINFLGSNNLAIIGKKISCSGAVTFNSNGGIFIVSGDTKEQCRFNNVKFLNEDSLFFFGKHSSCNGLVCILKGKNTKVMIGDDCMFAKDVWLRTSDMHAIFDIDSGQTLNFNGDIIINPHVWVCQDCLVLKNTEIGFGSIIGAKSLVNKKVSDFCLAGGVPVKEIRTNVSWDRTLKPTQRHIEYIRNVRQQLMDRV